MSHRDRTPASRNQDSPAKPPLQHFFKVVYPETIQFKKLIIPPSFSRGVELSDYVTLNVPGDGGAWIVGVTKTNEDILFDKDWPEFVKHYSIEPGNLLVFGYEGQSCFNVRIFNDTACEIQYPCGTGSPFTEEQQHLPDPEEHCEDGNASLDVLQSNPSSGEVGGEPSQMETPPLKRNLTSSQGINKRQKMDNQELDQKGISKSEKVQEAEKEDCFKKHKKEVQPDAPSRCAKGLSPEKGSAIQAAKMFNPRNPSSTLILRSHHVKRFLAYLPCKFARNYLSGLHGHIKFRLLDGREWSIRAIAKPCKGLSISKGFQEFVKDNNLKQGDVCVLEKIMEENGVLLVTIFRSDSVQSVPEMNKCQENNASKAMPNFEDQAGTDRSTRKPEVKVLGLDDGDESKTRSRQQRKDKNNLAAVREDDDMIISGKLSTTFAKASEQSKRATRASKLMKSN
ncbi:hypothetical protein Tsubulata_011090 [Turnera subulata]|uniref:TF-B3 domain-containing protein n=1 Tax=Turnera subulata TaxID=218843 RepID=A0A9Q0FBP8_9ROSI|nr:hypothetical protein Tsubulata_011090 [Turnera subulata]